MLKPSIITKVKFDVKINLMLAKNKKQKKQKKQKISKKLMTPKSLILW